MGDLSRNHGGGRLIRLGGLTPVLADDVFVAPGASIIGDVTIGAGASIWFNCVLRGDVGPISIGAGSNIQDGAVVHLSDRDAPARIGAHVTVGHCALLHGCTIDEWGFVGMGSIVMDGCHIHSFGMLAAGAMLTPRKTIGTRELWAGRPAKFLRAVTDDEVAMIRQGVAHYAANAAGYLSSQV